MPLKDLFDCVRDVRWSTHCTPITRLRALTQQRRSKEHRGHSSSKPVQPSSWCVGAPVFMSLPQNRQTPQQTQRDTVVTVVTAIELAGVSAHLCV
jgi:hypothetical protein